MKCITWPRLSPYKCWLMNYFYSNCRHESMFTTFHVHIYGSQYRLHYRWSSKKTQGGISSHSWETRNSLPQTIVRAESFQLNSSYKESLHCTILVTLMWYSKSLKEKLLEMGRVCGRNTIMHFAVLWTSQGFGSRRSRRLSYRCHHSSSSGFTLAVQV